jgi:hypothetical protein
MPEGTSNLTINVFSKASPHQPGLGLHAYSDAAFADTEDRKSTSGYLFSLLAAQYAISPASKISSQLRLLKPSTLLSPMLLRRQPGSIAYSLSLDTLERIPSLSSCTVTTSLLSTLCTLRVIMSALNTSIFTTTTSKTALKLGIYL